MFQNQKFNKIYYYFYLKYLRYRERLVTYLHKKSITYGVTFKPDDIRQILTLTIHISLAAALGFFLVFGVGYWFYFVIPPRYRSFCLFVINHPGLVWSYLQRNRFILLCVLYLIGLPILMLLIIVYRYFNK
jgi:hypothetical protein